MTSKAPINVEQWVALLENPPPTQYDARAEKHLFQMEPIQAPRLGSYLVRPVLNHYGGTSLDLPGTVTYVHNMFSSWVGKGKRKFDVHSMNFPTDIEIVKHVEGLSGEAQQSGDLRLLSKAVVLYENVDQMCYEKFCS